MLPALLFVTVDQLVQLDDVPSQRSAVKRIDRPAARNRRQVVLHSILMPVLKHSTYKRRLRGGGAGSGGRFAWVFWWQF